MDGRYKVTGRCMSRWLRSGRCRLTLPRAGRNGCDDGACSTAKEVNNCIPADCRPRWDTLAGANRNAGPFPASRKRCRSNPNGPDDCWGRAGVPSADDSTERCWSLPSWLVARLLVRRQVEQLRCRAGSGEKRPDPPIVNIPCTKCWESADAGSRTGRRRAMCATCYLTGRVESQARGSKKLESVRLSDWNSDPAHPTRRASQKPTCRYGRWRCRWAPGAAAGPSDGKLRLPAPRSSSCWDGASAICWPAAAMRPKGRGLNCYLPGVKCEDAWATQTTQELLTGFYCGWEPEWSATAVRQRGRPSVESADWRWDRGRPAIAIQWTIPVPGRRPSCWRRWAIRAGRVAGNGASRASGGHCG